MYDSNSPQYKKISYMYEDIYMKLKQFGFENSNKLFDKKSFIEFIFYKIDFAMIHIIRIYIQRLLDNYDDVLTNKYFISDILREKDKPNHIMLLDIFSNLSNKYPFENIEDNIQHYRFMDRLYDITHLTDKLSVTNNIIKLNAYHKIILRNKYWFVYINKDRDYFCMEDSDEEPEYTLQDLEDDLDVHPCYITNYKKFQKHEELMYYDIPEEDYLFYLCTLDHYIRLFDMKKLGPIMFNAFYEFLIYKGYDF